MRKILSFPLLFSLLILLGGCQKDNSDDASALSDGKLKQVLLFATIESKDPISIVEEYEYDEDGRISKVSSPMYDNGTIVGTIWYDLYEYNYSGQVTRIVNYHANLNSPTGFINLKNTSYTYSSQGKKLKEKIEYPLGGITEYSDFEYENGSLSRIKKYTGNKLENYTDYQYDKQNRLIRETFYASDGQCISYTIHSYRGSLQTRSDFYSWQTNNHYRSINRYFDKDNKLVTLESKELSLFSSLMSHVLRYTYYE